MENVLALYVFENRKGVREDEGATQLAPVHVVRGQATIQSNRKATTTTATKQETKINIKKIQVSIKRERETKKNNNNSKKCDARYVSIWRVNKIMIQKKI